MMMSAKYSTILLFAYFAVASSGCTFLTTTVSEDPLWLRFLPWLFALLGLGGVSATWARKKKVRVIIPKNKEVTIETSLKEKVQDAVASTIHLYRTELLAYLMVREAENRDLSNETLSKIRQQYGEIYALPYLRLSEDLLSLGKDFSLAEEAFSLYLEQQGCVPNRKRDIVSQVQEQVDIQVKTCIRDELDAFQAKMVG